MDVYGSKRLSPAYFALASHASCISATGAGVAIAIAIAIAVAIEASNRASKFIMGNPRCQQHVLAD